MKHLVLWLMVVAVLAGCAGTETTGTSPLPTDTAAPPPATHPAETATLSPPSPTPTPVPPTQAPPAAAAEPAIVIVRDGDLVLMRLSDRQEVPLTNLGDVVDFPEFSPDGRLILFRREGPPATVSSSMPEPVPTTTWWVVSIDGGPPRMILDPMAALPPVQGSGGLSEDVYPSDAGPFDWLPDDRTMLFTSRYLTINALPGNYDLWRLDVETGQLDALLPAGQGGRPVVSPDGEWVLLSSPTEITVARTDGSERQSLFTFERVPTYSEWEWTPEPLWNEDGTVQVAIARPWVVDEPAVYDLLRLDPASRAGETLGTVETWWLNTPIWSPDRTRLAYAPADNLVLAGGGGEEPRLVTATERVWPIAWSPTGTHLAFVQGSLHCVIEDGAGEEPLCVAPVFYGDAGWLDEDTLVGIVDAGQDQPQFVSVELPAGTVTEIWSVPTPLFYALYLGR